jgi:hypothetical protein
LPVGLDVLERLVERGVERVDHLAHRVPGVPTPGTTAGRVRAQRGQQRDRMHARPADPLRVAQLGNDLRNALRTGREHADPGQVLDERRHRHVLQQRLPDLGRGQVVALERLARQAVLANERSRLHRLLDRLRTSEALHDARQTVCLAAADDPLEQACLVR